MFTSNRVRRVLAGSAAGLISTIPMTAVMLVGHRFLAWHERYPLPPRQITMRLVRSLGLAESMNEPARTAATTVAHFGYGAAMGALYGILVRSPNDRYPATGAAFGLLVWTGSYLGYLPALGILRPATEHPTRRTALMIAAHFVWGGTLGRVTERLLARQERK